MGILAKLKVFRRKGKAVVGDVEVCTSMNYTVIVLLTPYLIERRRLYIGEARLFGGCGCPLEGKPEPIPMHTCSMMEAIVDSLFPRVIPTEMLNMSSRSCCVTLPMIQRFCASVCPSDFPRQLLHGRYV